MAIVLFGATSFTGRLVLDSLRKLGSKNLILAARHRDKLTELGQQYDLETRFADAQDAASLDKMVKGARVVVSTVGPFTLHGEPVVRAALGAKAHFVDTTGEQAYMSRMLERYHGSALERNLTVVNAQAFEFAMGYCAAAVLTEKNPSLHTVDVFNRVSGLGASRGTQKSALEGLVAPALIRRGGRLVSRGPSPLPMKVQIPSLEEVELAVPFPGGEALHLSRVAPGVKNVTTNLVLPKPLAMSVMALWSARPLLKRVPRKRLLSALERRIDAGPEGPSSAQRSQQRFFVFARGQGKTHHAGVVLRGRDPYGITGTIAALGAHWLAEGKHKKHGVISCDQAFGADDFLQALEPYDVSQSFHDLDN